jgi:hypothetical protein
MTEQFTKPILFTFGNFYLAGIHAGIQAAHVCTKLGELARTSYTDVIRANYSSWEAHPTMNVRHAGMQRDIVESFTAFGKLAEASQTNYPFAAFYEEAGALSDGKPMTCWGVVLPFEVYAAERQYDKLTNNVSWVVPYEAGTRNSSGWATTTSAIYTEAATPVEHFILTLISRTGLAK